MPWPASMPAAVLSAGIVTAKGEGTPTSYEVVQAPYAASVRCYPSLLPVVSRPAALTTSWSSGQAEGQITAASSAACGAGPSARDCLQTCLQLGRAASLRAGSLSASVLQVGERTRQFACLFASMFSDRLPCRPPRLPPPRHRDCASTCLPFAASLFNLLACRPSACLSTIRAIGGGPADHLFVCKHVCGLAFRSACRADWQTWAGPPSPSLPRLGSVLPAWLAGRLPSCLQTCLQV